MVWEEAEGSDFHLGNILGLGGQTNGELMGETPGKRELVAGSTLPQSLPILMNPTPTVSKEEGKAEN